MGAIDNNSVAMKGRVRVDLQVRYRCDEIFAPEDKTTLMLRGIPRSFTEEDFIHRIEAVTGGQFFDFIYLPWDTKRNANMGFAFVNCVEARVARELLSTIQSQTISFARDTQRPIVALFGHVQGLTLNVAHYIGSSVVGEGQEHAPIIFHGGRRITFQEAVDRFVPAELAEAQLREAELAKSSAAAPNEPQVKTQALLAPKSAPPVLSYFGKRQERPSPKVTCVHGMLPASVVPSQKSKVAAVPLSWPVSHSAAAGPAHPVPHVASKNVILQSPSYAAAWARLNDQLEVLSAISGTASVASPSAASDASLFRALAGVCL